MIISGFDPCRQPTLGAPGRGDENCTLGDQGILNCRGFPSSPFSESGGLADSSTVGEPPAIFRTDFRSSDDDSSDACLSTAGGLPTCLGRKCTFPIDLSRLAKRIEAGCGFSTRPLFGSVHAAPSSDPILRPQPTVREIGGLHAPAEIRAGNTEGSTPGTPRRIRLHLFDPRCILVPKDVVCLPPVGSDFARCLSKNNPILRRNSLR
jgi:hypothetical protein